ncbi:MAG: twin-arginine translocation pathway signal [Pseudomonadota bacterium]
MARFIMNRRRLLGTAGAATLIGAPALAQGVAATPTMRGGSNNYRPGAPIVDRIGGGGFLMTGRVRRAVDGVPLAGRRIQMWAHTTEGHERDVASHGATLTDADGLFQMDMPQIVPAFGQAHGHLAYDAEQDSAFGGGEFQTVFLRPLMASPNDATLHVEFVLVEA